LRNYEILYFMKIIILYWRCQMVILLFLFLFEIFLIIK